MSIHLKVAAAFIELCLIVALSSHPYAQTGTLTIRSEPGTEVIWEGISLGYTDANGSLTINDIPPARFSLRLKKEGFRELVADIEVAEGRKSTKFSLVPMEPVVQETDIKVTEKRPDTTSGGRSIRSGTQMQARRAKFKQGISPKSDRTSVSTKTPGSQDDPNRAGTRNRGTRGQETTSSSPIRKPQVSPYPIVALVCSLALLAGAVYAFRKDRSKSSPPVRLSPTLTRYLSVDLDHRTGRGLYGDFFLDDLKRTEQALESGKPRVIDILPIDVSESEDEK